MQFPSTPRRWKSARDDDDDVSTFCISSTRALPSFPSSSPLFIVSEMAPSPYLFHTVYCTLFTIRQTHTRTRIPTNHNHHQSFVRTITSSFHFISFHFFLLSPTPPAHTHTHTSSLAHLAASFARSIASSTTPSSSISVSLPFPLCLSPFSSSFFIPRPTLSNSLCLWYLTRERRW